MHGPDRPTCWCGERKPENQYSTSRQRPFCSGRKAWSCSSNNRRWSAARNQTKLARGLSRADNGRRKAGFSRNATCPCGEKRGLLPLGRRAAWARGTNSRTARSGNRGRRASCRGMARGKAPASDDQKAQQCAARGGDDRHRTPQTLMPFHARNLQRRRPSAASRRLEFLGGTGAALARICQTASLTAARNCCVRSDCALPNSAAGLPCSAMRP